MEERIKILQQPWNRVHIANTELIPHPGLRVPADVAYTVCGKVLTRWTYADMLNLKAYAHVSYCDICFPNYN